MDKLFRNKYRVNSSRHSSWDYSSNGYYFITICTRTKAPYFGHINVNGLVPTNIGTFTSQCWKTIPEHHPFIILDSFVLMPDHLHGILSINKNEQRDWNQNKFGAQSKNLGAVIRGFKGAVKLFANTNSTEFDWQKGYYDRIIRNVRELNQTRDYIQNNPKQWLINKTM